MDFSGSGWSSGCESGWTVYLDQSSSLSSNPYGRRRTTDVIESCYIGQKGAEEEEEDLSMVSDASSGPPTQHNNAQEDYINVEEEDYCRNYRPQVEVSSSRKKKGGAERRKKSSSKGQIPFKSTEDTASSPPLMVYSKGNSAAYDIDNHTHQLGFWRSSNPQNPDSAEPSCLRGRRRRE